MSSPPITKRQNIRLPGDDYRGRRSYFVTLCFDCRRKLGVDPRLALWLIERLKEHAAHCSFYLHAYCLMPDHLHVLATAAEDEGNLMKFVESFKQETGFAFEQRTTQRLWQSKYFDRVLRKSDAIDRMAWYIWMNPVRQGLCRTPGEYPFLGSSTEVGKKMLSGPRCQEWKPDWR